MQAISQASRRVLASGSEYLRLATALLQRMRLTSATGGIWEAADVQWWSRRERSTDRHGQLFWLDDQDEPLAAVVLTDWGSSIQCDALVLPDDPGHVRTVWNEALGRAGALGLTTVEFPVRKDDAAAISMLAGAGLRASSEPGVVASWLEAARRPAVPVLPPGYRLMSQAEAPGHLHPLVARNGPEVADRLGRCSLYRPDLDLMVEAPDGRAAGYGLFWADPVTRVGLVEPMRTEEPHRGRGIASCILTTGLGRLAASGCDRLKVSNDISLYLRAGFRPLRTATAAIYARSPTMPGLQRNAGS